MDDKSTSAYSLDDIIRAWQDYTKEKAFCVLKDGKWKNTPLVYGTKPETEGATSARIRPLMDVMDFPNYLEAFWTGK